MIRDRIVAGIRDASLSEKLQMDDRLTLETPVKKAKESEAIKQQQQTIRHDEAIEVDAVRKGTSKQSLNAQFVVSIVCQGQNLSCQQNCQVAPGKKSQLTCLNGKIPSIYSLLITIHAL